MNDENLVGEKRTINPTVDLLDFAERSSIELISEGEGVTESPSPSHSLLPQALTAAHGQMTPVPSPPQILTSGFRTRTPNEIAGGPAGDRTTGQSALNVLQMPRFTFGIVLALLMAFSCILGVSEPLHLVLLSSGYSSPFVPGTLGFIDLFFVLTPIVIGYWAFCLLRLSDAFTYKSSSSRTLQRAITLGVAVLNPIVLGCLIVLANFAAVIYSGPLYHSIAFIFSTALFALSVVVSVISAGWYYKFVRKVVALNDAAAKHWFFKANLPALIVGLCYVIPMILFVLAGYYHPIGLDHSWKPVLNSSDTVGFLFEVTLGLFTACIGQTLSFLILKQCVKEIPVLKKPTESEPRIETMRS